ncbi:GNAT family N-acetyltransferase [Streptomyces sp. NBC_00306]|uniref:GNAT family N-acetyltransferase n=1 Tax=Streptomyces sp. NBC_00306 TaxID=2975708 RepID=UPI002E28BD60|nr:GNAT family N-acetyltransferase [Streptomyces sp. NBC_00306]
MIRLARATELTQLQDVERAAGKCFADIGMAAIAEDEPPSLTVLGSYAQDGRAWVWAEDDDLPVAYLIAELVDGNGHVEQVSVHPDHAGRRIGKALIEHAGAWATAQGAPALTLTTFTEVVWNGPYYEKLGFRLVPEAVLTPGLREIRAAEAAHGLDRWPRACMRKEL